MVTKRQIEKTTVYPLFSLFTQFSAVAMSIRYSAGCDYLGEMRNYWEDGTLRISHRQDRRITDTKKANGKVCCKVRGFTLNRPWYSSTKLQGHATTFTVQGNRDTRAKKKHSCPKTRITATVIQLPKRYG